MSSRIADSVVLLRWDAFEIALNGPAGGNPFRDVRIAANFQLTMAVVIVILQGFRAFS